MFGEKLKWNQNGKDIKRKEGLNARKNKSM